METDLKYTSKFDKNKPVHVKPKIAFFWDILVINKEVLNL